ncbi:hypothetical protein [Winogradskya humida]|uniref:hypothetical protein n=1 Tax=Winogradskya humida TaxID=113566 RepID=UPI001941876B|nr:hypothetical protein [Actinoplanes humidus]
MPPGLEQHSDVTDNEPVTGLIDAMTAIMADSVLLARQLHHAGLLSDQALTALLAQEDQISAGITQLGAGHK